MEKSLSFLILYIVTLFVSFGVNSSPVTFVTNHWPPYVYDDSFYNRRGFFTDLVARMCESQGVEVEIVYAPWLRAETMVRHGLAFAAFPYAITEARSQYADFSMAITKSANPPRIFYYAPLVPTTSSLSFDQLIQYRVGTYLGYFVKEKLDEKGVDYVLAQTEEKAFEMLQKGRIDYLPADPESGWNIIQSRFSEHADAFGLLPDPFPGTSLHLMVSREYPNASSILAKCNQGFKAMIEDGTYYQFLTTQDKSDYAVGP